MYRNEAATQQYDVNEAGILHMCILQCILQYPPANKRNHWIVDFNHGRVNISLADVPVISWNQDVHNHHDHIGA